MKNQQMWKGLKKRKAIVIVAVLLFGVMAGAFLYAWYFLKPELNAFDMVADRSSIEFNVQNFGKADAHNVKIEVNGTWISRFKMNVTSVERRNDATIFNGTINEWGEQAFELAQRIVPSITGGKIPLPPMYGAVDYPTSFELEVNESGALRYLTDSEVVSLIDAFENPRDYYVIAEAAIEVLRMGEIQTETINLNQPSHFYAVTISCDEGATLQFSKWRP